MSAGWAFYSFDHGRFEELFVKGDDAIVQPLVEYLTDEEYFGLDEEIAQRVAANGFRYDRATPEEQDVLDCFPIAIFDGSEALGRAVDIRAGSPEGLVLNVVGALLDRAEGRLETRLLPVLDSGRRYGCAASEFCDYVIFSPSEVAELLAEVRAVVNLDAQWPDPELPAIVEEELVGPLQTAADAGRGLAALAL
jgi:hypothetical protein